MSFVQTLAESPNLQSIPPIYTYTTNSNYSPASDPEDSLPVIDLSLLMSSDPDLRAQVVQELGKACKDWGFFQVINHGVPETLMDMVIRKVNEFFNLREDEKKEFEAKHVLDPITYGTSHNSKKDKVFSWRDFLKVHIHPDFHSPNKPLGFSEVLSDYSKRTRDVVRALLGGISESLGLQQSYAEKVLKFESGFQMFVANFFPPCPQPELAIGIPPHSDHSLLTLLISNGVPGLQINHDGKWINIKEILPNSFLVNVADQLEIFSNGKYKSVEHRAVVNNKSTRVSVALGNGPSLDAVVSPASELVDDGRCPAAYVPMKYKQYLELQQDNPIVGKTALDRVRV